MRIVAFMNQKGGVGKTTSVVNLGSILAREFGKKVLLIDLDPQGNMSDHLGLDPLDTENSVYDIIINAEPPAKIVQSRFGMDIIPANINLAGAEVELACMTIRETRLRNAMRGFCRDYDIVLIDCPPSLGLLTLSGLCLATEVIVPMQAEYLAMRGLGQLVHTVGLIKQGLNQKLKITGIVFCQYNVRPKLSNEVIAEVTEHFPDEVYKSKIRKNIKLAESPSNAMPTIDHEPVCAGVDDYRQLAIEFLQRGGEDIETSEMIDEESEDNISPPESDITFVE